MSGAGTNWERFCDDAASIMRDAQANKINLEEASIFFERSNAISNQDLRAYVEKMVWEIGGSPGLYAELTELFASRSSQEEMVRYLNSGDSFVQALWSAIAFWRRSKA